MNDLDPDLQQLSHDRAAASRAIVESAARRKLVVAGPGTGKTFTFKQALEACGGEGLALTFIRNLVRDLDDELGSLAGVFTFHGFCKHQLHRTAVAGLSTDWDYYPPLPTLLSEDLTLAGRPTTSRQLDDLLHDLREDDERLGVALGIGEYYDAVSHTDLIYRALRHFREHPDQVPEYPLVVVDEYQDFNRLDTEFLAVLIENSPALIAGDDDQSLYSFRQASPEFIRALAEDGEFERFELPFCSRCPEVVVAAVNDTIRAAQEQGHLDGRLNKEFMCFLPDKKADSDRYPTIKHVRCSVERSNARYGGRYIANEISRIPAEDVAASRYGDYPTALIVGPNPFLSSAMEVLSEAYPQTKLLKSELDSVRALDGYRRLAEKPDSRLGWRILLHCFPIQDSKSLVSDALLENTELAEEVPATYREHHLEVAQLLAAVAREEELGADDAKRLSRATGQTIEEIKASLGLIDPAKLLDDEEPLPDEAPTVACTSLVGAKGLSASHVFVVGFNDLHFPQKPLAVTDDEICSFLVALSRTRKECHLISCGMLGAERRVPSSFARWVSPHLETVTVNAKYFTTHS